jgi:hypothetical protein
VASTVQLSLQDPGSSSGYLLETLLEVSAGADRGGGIFAWATAGGVRLLLGDPDFRDSLADVPFDLIVGVDWVTDQAALDAIALAQERIAGMTARAFVHDLQPLIFHPKFSWFRHDDSVTVIAGSGNLTKGGLRSNWELFTTARAVGREADEIERRIEDWMERWKDELLPLDDSRVQERAARNTGLEELPQQPRVRRPARQPTVAVRKFTGSEAVLIAEIPKGDRWKQANFYLDDYVNFFGASLGSQQRVWFQHVNADATLGELESRPSVEVRSQNYRFELAAAAGLPYPTAGRPIGVFVKMPDGTFLYRLLMPGGDSYETIARFLRDRTNVSATRMKRIRIDARELREVWPGSPIWQAPPAP